MVIISTNREFETEVSFADSAVIRSAEYRLNEYIVLLNLHAPVRFYIFGTEQKYCSIFVVRIHFTTKRYLCFHSPDRIGINLPVHPARKQTGSTFN